MTAADDVETDLAEHFARALADVADEFNKALDGGGSLTAAAFRVSSITAMWRRHVTPLVERTLAAYEQAARWTATGLGTDMPPGWGDLPGQAPGSLPDPVAEYRAAVEDLLDGVGEQLGERARAVLAAGLDADESPDQLRDRLRETFAVDGPQLGPGRAERLARTEATRVWNAATLAAAQTVAEPGQTLVKEWIARSDASVRSAHRAANGQRRSLDEPFTVGGVPMSGPGDSAAPPALTVNCRCTLRVVEEQAASAVEIQEAPSRQLSNPREPGVTTPQAVTAANAHTGAMIALVPSAADAERLAVPGGEAADELHLTLYFLGEVDDWTPEQQTDLTDRLRDWATGLDQPIPARAFGANKWNADTDNPVWVWAVSDNPDRDQVGLTLDAVHTAVTNTATNGIGPATPTQHTPWQPHVTAAYSSDPALLDELEARLGEITFDRLRIAFAGEYVDVPLGPEETPVDEEPDTPAVTAAGMATRTWSTPGDTGLAFEDQQTGDGRLFAAEALHWDGAGPWPLQYADEMLMGHEGAELAGAIQMMGRDGDRITAAGVLYTSRPAGADAAMLLDEGAPLGVSVDLDDVDVEFVDTSGNAAEPALAASLVSASVLRLADGAVVLTAQTSPEWTASGIALCRARSAAQVITGPGGRITAAAARHALTGTGALTAAAGDPDPTDGTVVHAEQSGELVLRITRGRVRGATLVAMPAYDKARIVLDPVPVAEPGELAEPEKLALAAAGKPGPDHRRVVSYVSASPVPVGARVVAQALRITMRSARGHLARAAHAGRIVRLAPGLYVGCTATLAEGTELSAAMSGDTDLPIHADREYEWDGDAAAGRVLDWATDADGSVDAERLGEAYLWRDDEADPATSAAYKLPFADVFGSGADAELHIVPRAVFAIAAVLQGGRGGVDIPDAEQDEIRSRVEALYARLADEFDDPELRAPWLDDEPGDELDEDELAASAWSAMRDTDAMPAAWFKEPTAAELPPGSGGVHYKDGRIYGWVAQAGEPHAGFPGKNLTIESLGKIDTTHFLRAKFALDDGTQVKAGAFTMNAPHNRDGAECETSACQFDDTRTVAGIVTVGMNSRGLWFSGAAGPWMSEWDRTVFQACQPSYHMKQGPGRRWQLRAVLSVPVPGHSSPLIATAVAERSNLALAASAAYAITLPEQTTAAPTGTANELLAALTDSSFLDGLAAALQRRESERDADLRAEIDRMAADMAPSRTEITASAARRGDR